MTVLLFSHVLADVEAVCDHLLLLSDGRERLAGDIDDLASGHRLMIGPHRSGGHGFTPSAVVEARATERQQTVLVKAGGWIDATGWDQHQPTLEELATAYLRTVSPAPATPERATSVLYVGMFRVGVGVGAAGGGRIRFRDGAAHRRPDRAVAGIDAGD